MGKNFFRTGVMAGVFSALLVLSACTFTIQPEGSTPGDEAPPTDVTSMAIAEWVLPDGTSCLFSGTGATIAFDGKRANYTCEPVDASDSTTTTQVLLNDPVIAGPTEYLVDFATVAHTDGGFELHSSEAITYTAWQIVLEDGRVCLHAGFGATMGFDDRRLNYTCDKGDSTADEVGLMGELTNMGEGVWVAQIDEIGRTANGFEQLSSTTVPVAVVSGAEVQPGDSATTPPVTEVDSGLIGTTWQWIETVYGDDSVLVANDPSRYTLTFGTDGRVAAQFDCNSGGGEFTVDGSSLIFGAMITTLMGCPEGSQADAFTADLAQVYSYVIQDGHLFLSMQLDSGIMEFAPADEAVGEDEATSTPEASEEADASQELVGTTWQWVGTVYGDDTVVTVEEPSRYTLTFNADGTVGVQFDCNSGGGEFTVEGPMLSFGPMRTTLMACPEDSQVDIFATDLENVNSFVLQDGHLFLAIKLDTGIMEFAPLGATEEATEDAEMTNVLADTTWQWERSVYEGDMARVVHDPSRYTITFNADGSLAAQLDCNSGRGTYTLEGDRLSFGPIASTRMGCPPDSQDGVFAQDLAAVESFALVDGNLHLTLSTDGVMEFSPVQ